MDIGNTLPKLLALFAGAFFQFGWSLPIAVLAGVDPILAIITASLSYALGVAVTLVFGGRLRNWLLNRFGKRITENPNNAVHRIWKRFGVVGLSLIAPMTVGAQIGAVIAIALGAPPRRLFFWMTVGAILWGIIITLVVIALRTKA